jgi:hypothetical protein
MKAKLSALRFFSAMTVGGKFSARPSVRFRLATAFFVFAAIASSTNISLADEDGVSFWIPGLFGSLAATPQQPGWSLASIYHHTAVSASGNAPVAREITSEERRGETKPNARAARQFSADCHRGEKAQRPKLRSHGYLFGSLALSAQGMSASRRS